MTNRYRVALREAARSDLAAIKDARTRKAVSNRLVRREEEPKQQGKPLSATLRGFYSVRAAGGRYRIIYALEELQNLVIVVVIGIRKEGDKRDAYAVARKRLT